MAQSIQSSIPTRARTRLAIALTSLLTLAGCESSIGPVNIVLEPRTGFDLKSESGKRIAFISGRIERGTLKFDGSSKKLILELRGEKLTFKGAKYDKEHDRVTISPMDSKQTTSQGERVGAEGERRLICNPACSEDHVTTETIGCTRYEMRPIQVCTGGRRPHCHIEWREVAFPGRQLAEITRTLFRYDVEALLSGEKSGAFATARGVLNETRTTIRELSVCR